MPTSVDDGKQLRLLTDAVVHVLPPAGVALSRELKQRDLHEDHLRQLQLQPLRNQPRYAVVQQSERVHLQQTKQMVNACDGLDKWDRTRTRQERANNGHNGRSILQAYYQRHKDTYRDTKTNTHQHNFTPPSRALGCHPPMRPHAISAPPKKNLKEHDDTQRTHVPPNTARTNIRLTSLGNASGCSST